MSYGEYINSEVEYIGSVPKSWQIIRNKHIFNKTKVIAGHNWEKYNVLSLTKKGVIIKDIERNEGKMPSDFSIYQIVNPGNLLMCLFDIDVTPRCVGYIENKGIVSAAYTELSSTKDINMKYYYWWYLMLDIDKQLLHLSKNLRNSLSTEDFMALSVVKPPLEEQKQIANYLDKKTAKIDATIVKNKELIDLLEEKRVALINQVVTKGLNPNVPMKDSGVEWIGEIPEHWEVRNLKYVATLQTGTTPKKNIGVNHEKGINWFTPGDFDNTYKLAKSDRFIEKEAIKTNNIKIYPPNSILMVCIGATIGKLGVTNDVSYSNQQITAILSKPNINYIYLLYYLISNTELIKETANFTTLPILNNQHLSAFPVLCPPILEQKQIAEYLDKENYKINITISKIKENINLLEEYKTSLIYHVVTGKIDVRGEKI